MGFSNKNLESDLGVNAERLEKQSSQLLAPTSMKSSEFISLWILRLNPDLLSSTVLYSSQPYHSQKVELKVYTTTAWSLYG